VSKPAAVGLPVIEDAESLSELVRDARAIPASTFDRHGSQAEPPPAPPARIAIPASAARVAEAAFDVF